MKGFKMNSGWTLEWTFKRYDGSTELAYPEEYWNGGFMKWSVAPNERFIFNTKEELEQFISKALWDKKDPANKSYRIVQVKLNSTCTSLVGRDAVAYGCEYFDVSNHKCNCPHDCEYKSTIVIKENSECSK